MAAVVRLETVVDVDVPERRAGPGADGSRFPQVPSAGAQPGLWPGPRPVGDPRQVSVSAVLSAVLGDGHRITLLDDRGWSSTETWDRATVSEIEDTARTVVGPDEPVVGQTREEMADRHWTDLAARLAMRNVVVDAAVLRSLPHAVVLSERLRARVHRT